MNPMPPPDMPPSIQKPQKSFPNASVARAINCSVKWVDAHGMMAWIGPRKLRVVAAPNARMSPALSAPMTSSSTDRASCRPTHSAADRSRYFSVTISRMGPTFWAMPPCTTTRESCNALRADSGISSRRYTWWVGISRPREIPNSGSSPPATVPVMSLIPGQTPPESCHPPPEPPSHSPSNARANTRRRSDSSNAPVNDAACPVARMHTLMSDPNRFVLTASRDPLGMSFTHDTISRPRPTPTRRASRSCSECPEPSIPGGTTPDAITAAFNNPR